MFPCRNKINFTRLYRHTLRRTTFIGITGSCGKTTTRDLAASILGCRYLGHKSNLNISGREMVTDCLHKVRPWHRFSVDELSGAVPGRLAPIVKEYRPDIAVLTVVGQDHYTRFRCLDKTAAEKGTLVEGLRYNGTAILNADDQYVMNMRYRTRARVFTYGLSAEATLRAEEINSNWPQRLSLTVVYGNKSVLVRTRLLGTHWTTSVLAALSTGLIMQVPLEVGVCAVEDFNPIEGRMSAHETADGITFIRDDWKAPFWTIPTVLHFMETASANRKIIIIGTISDYPGSSSPKYRAVARRALDGADKVFFVGPFSQSAVKARAHPKDLRIMAFSTLKGLDRYLHEFLKPGDLVLLKGSNRVDHLERLVLSRKGKWHCWRSNCRITGECSYCELKDRSVTSHDIES